MPPDPGVRGDRLTADELSWMMDEVEKLGHTTMTIDEYERWFYASACDSFSYDTYTNEARIWGYAKDMPETVQAWHGTSCDTLSFDAASKEAQIWYRKMITDSGGWATGDYFYWRN
ncbi:hypothetical protein KAU11_06755 [Candidatus Babeliales bacterium]|nr:hypothetical protein [Candidatus Babeliales bacterium]